MLEALVDAPDRQGAARLPGTAGTARQCREFRGQSHVHVRLHQTAATGHRL